MKLLHWFLLLLFVCRACSPEKVDTSVPGHDLEFSCLATTWDEAIPLGNGILGALVWQKGDNLRLSLDRADLWDLRPVDNFDKPEFSFKMLCILLSEDPWFGRFVDFFLFDNDRDMRVVTIWRMPGLFAAAERHDAIVIRHEFHRGEFRALVRAVAERLGFAHAAGTPHVCFAFLHDDAKRAFSGHDGLFTHAGIPR